MKKRKLIIILALVAIVGIFILTRPKAKNYEVAYINKNSDGYEIEMKGTRYLMVHDPISALLSKTYEANHKLKIPRITGIVEGSEIPVKKGYYSYLGNIVFNNNKMIVDLYYDNYDDNIKDPLSWNGKYTTIKN